MRTSIMNEAWNDGNTTPEKPGLYVRDYSGTPAADGETLRLICRWDGLRWFVGYADTVPAKLTKTPARYQDLPWRELTAQDQAGDLVKGVAA